MYIQPNSNVFIFHNVPFCEAYEDTMDFSSASQQWTYLADHYLKYSFNKYSYQRANKNSIKIEKTCDDLYDCNYMAFVNVAYGNKVFYCFIKEVNYINDNVTEIVYEIDPIQTWMFEYQLGECFVEREHTPDDAIGNNLVPENLDTGDYNCYYVYNENDQVVDGCEDLKNLCIVLFSTIDENYQGTGGQFDGRTYSGLYAVIRNGDGVTRGDGVYFNLNSAGVAACNDWINNLPILSINAIQMAVIMPRQIADITFVQGGQQIKKNQILLRADGTQVRNNKCLCYPYNFLYATNYQGKVAEYHYEYFTSTSGNCLFNVYGDRTPNPSAVIVPLNYKGISENYDESLSISNYPQIAFKVDAFKAWLAQNASTVATSALTMAYVKQGVKAGAKEGMGANILKYGGVHGVIAGVVGGVSAMIQPPQAHGTQSGAMNISAGQQNIAFMNKRIRPEYATIIDDYFQMFGYACHQVKTPTAHNRIKWDYVKTVGCVVHGSLPADEAKRIKDIYDKGIRFWHYGATMYDYDTANNTVL